MRRATVLLLSACMLRAADGTGAMTARLSEEADAFRRLAPLVLGTETLVQKALKRPKRFRLRVGAAAQGPPTPEFQERDLVSEYAFAEFAGEAQTVHELRKVVSVDGRAVSDSAQAQETLARVLTLKDDARERALLKEFEKYGLLGAVTDFGPLILLFTPRDILRYEFSGPATAQLAGTPVLIYKYTQIDGPEQLTVFDTDANGQARRMRAAGEVWVRASDYLPVRITLSVSRGDGATALHEDASVDYQQSPFGALLPAAIHHSEHEAGKLVSENTFTYGPFHKFGASLDIHFDSGDSGPAPAPAK
jgi:hypothetical protein